MKVDVAKVMIEMARNCMTQKELARKSGLSPAVISNYFTRGSAPPSGVGRIAKALGVDIITIVKDD